MLLERARAWAKVLPPHAKVWLEDHLFEQLGDELYLQNRVTPAWREPFFAIRLRTILIMPKRARTHAAG